MRQFIDIIGEYADPSKRQSDFFAQGSAQGAPETILKRPGFKEWFSGSKVASPSGEPLAAFHGTFQDFTKFTLDGERVKAYGFNRLGFWFDVDPRTPEHFAGYSGDASEWGSSTGSVMLCVLSIKNPFRLSSEYLFSAEAEELRAASAEFSRLNRMHQKVRRDALGNARLPDGSVFDERAYREASKRYDELRGRVHSISGSQPDRIDAWTTMMNLLPNGVNSTSTEVDAFRESLIAEGHDGIYIGDTAADFGTRNFDATDWWIAFRPNQIKSIFAKSFSDSDDILEGV